MSAGISLVVLPFAIAIALFMAGHPPRGPARPGFDQAADVVLIVWTLIALPAGILVLRDTVRHRGRLSRDLVEGHAWDFAELSVLPASRILVAPEERRGQPVEVTTAAPRPESFHAVPVELVHAETGEKRQFLQRRLSDDEARELVAHAEEPLWSWWLVWPAIIGTGWIVASLRGERAGIVGMWVLLL